MNRLEVFEARVQERLRRRRGARIEIQYDLVMDLEGCMLTTYVTVVSDIRNPAWWILDRFIHLPEPLRRHGLGCVALETLVQHLRTYESAARLEVSPVDENAAAFYRGVGFVPLHAEDPYANLIRQLL